MIKVYNTLTRKKEDFILPAEQVNMYVCGITPYDFCHIGHARCYIVYDTIYRYLRYRGYNIFYIQNFTDIDDKIIQKAKEENISPLNVSKKYIEEYYKDMDALCVKRADIYPKVTEHISDIIRVIEGLIEKKYAYESEGSVYFSVEKFTHYGKLSGRTLEDMLAGARVEIDENKKNPLDFALWKKAKEEEISWESPWGKGRPGWHIECSAMSTKYLGEQITVHGGAIELIFPHHENEIAQSEAYTGKAPFVRYWIHNGLVTVSEQKMSKSLGNFITVKDILKKYSPQVIRFFLLSTNYRNPIDFSESMMKSAKSAILRLHNTKKRMEEVNQGGNLRGYPSMHFNKKVDELKEKFIEVMDDDFNSAQAMAVLFELSGEINKFIDEVGTDKSTLNNAYQTFMDLSDIFGILEKGKEENYEEVFPQLVLSVKNEGWNIETKNKTAEEIINTIILLRNKARQEKNWKFADEIRGTLKELNIIIEDAPDKTTFKLIK